jgi:hypothetical protein
MNESQDKRAVYMGTFEAYKKATGKQLVEFVDITQNIWKFTSTHTVTLYVISLTALTLSVLALVI